jgi:hypothetical protein
MEKLHYWNLMKSVPKDRLKTIQAGRLKGKSDINPQWRYEKLTEVFGPCGFGWKYTIEKTWVQEYANGEIASFAQINLYVKIDDIWSDAIPANGGSMFVANESRGPYVSDECFKMAITDALGTAAKMLGVASDVYQGLSDSKYSAQPQQATQQAEDTRPWLNKGESLNKAMEMLRTGKVTIPAIEKKYRLSKEIRASLQTVIDGLS